MKHENRFVKKYLDVDFFRFVGNGKKIVVHQTGDGENDFSATQAAYDDVVGVESSVFHILQKVKTNCVKDEHY